MSDLTNQRERANALMGHDGNVRVVLGQQSEGSGADGKFASDTERPAARNFSPFVEEDAFAAVAVAARMARVARNETSLETGIEAALDVAQRVIVDEKRSGVGKFALELFAAHSPKGRELRLARPIETNPASLVGSTRATSAGPVDYWREDPLANEHHLHWHIIYPSTGIILDDAPQELLDILESRSRPLTDDEWRQVVRYQDRHGEMFIYMHQQMLARYDAERLALGLAPVEPLDLSGGTVDLGEGINVGPPIEFDPAEPENGGFQDRPDGAQLAPAWHARLRDATDHLREAIAANAFKSPTDASIPIDADLLGVNIEAGLGIFRGGVDRQYYGNLHNNGHNAIAAVPEDPGGPANQIPGVMATPVLNLRDPVFWRWHRLIDNLSAEWQERQAAEDFADLPAVELLDLQLFDDAFVGAPDSEARTACADALGASWPDTVAQHAVTTLKTRIKNVDVPMPDGGTRNIDHLVHEPFGWAARVRSLAAEEISVTLRLFMAPTSRRDDRRNWIEIDKRLIVLPPGAEAVTIRSGTEAEIVKKPVDQGPDFFIPAESSDDPRCTCGWPYPLLVPRGTGDGIDYSLFAVLTDASVDGFTNGKTCGSISFCGARDTSYMDKREMGYPFHRRWTEPLVDVMTAKPQMLLQSIKIVHQ
jgi:hypothetical protein